MKRSEIERRHIFPNSCKAPFGDVEGGEALVVREQDSHLEV